MNKRGQVIDMEILTSMGFWALLILTLGATAIGWVVSTNMDYSFPLWQIIIFMLFEVVIVYVIALRMFD